MEHINFEGRQIAQGETFTVWPGRYEVKFVGTEGDRILLADASGEFSRPLRSGRPTNFAPQLGERRTVVEVVPNPRPTTDGTTVYVLTHQMCIPGGWKAIKQTRWRAPEGLAGVYGPAGLEIEHEPLRKVADRLFDGAQPIIDAHPYTELVALLSTLRLQEGHGKAGGWDDPGLGFRISELLEQSHTI
ncbi:hypothetical protein [Streptomyces malaysiensis]|uniref:Uncharacterized protein n=1 Tax=Streptomyces malaysiensis TaxID=92644 RepID=A0A7X6AZK2_STRMQ|nr:hypothetical protein [Streptomyces malaysiensis]NIY68108.1 hypothetical protein [Streptomyces malaysiensis]